MSDDNDLSNKATIDSHSGKSVSFYSEVSDSETITIDDENASLLRNDYLSNRNIEQKEDNKFLSIILLGLSAFAFSIMSLCVKVSNKKYPFFQSVFALSIFQAIGGYIGCKLAKVSPWGHPEQYLLLVCRGAFGAVGITFFFAGMTYLSLADNTVVFFTGPVITAVIAWIILGEKLTLLDGFLFLLSLSGVTLVSKPEFLFSSDDDTNDNDYSSLYFLLPLISAFMSAFAYIIVLCIGNGVHYFVHVFYFGVVSTVISFSSLFIFHIQEPMMPESIFDCIIYILIAVFGFIGQYLLNRGLLFNSTGPGTLMKNLDVVFAFIFGILVLGEIPKWNSILGASIIICSSVGMGIKKFIQKKNESTLSIIAFSVSIDDSFDDDNDDE